ncbi:alpha/beta hydrolase [Mycobacterium sp.]|uniref:alpha/beta fold hydrolase n=1 Tax=Mycobacterium sp. TaxID=1785 RepID=UPI002D54646A|nr:alpha/beta hydrolase [Mycobacterium sp.]HZA11536.1 alpha/beta hydrolase [Mycobacterium sp.]
MPPPAPSVVRIDGPWRHLEVHANGIRFHVVEAEEAAGPAAPPDIPPPDIPPPDIPLPDIALPDTALPNSQAAAATTRPLVMLLHGFGSFWWSWRHQLRGLRGARVVAVDLRGYGGSDKPPRGYDGWTLAGDTAGLIRALGHTSATLVGHADGGLVCWATSVLHPRLIRAIALVSSPHPIALRASALTRRDQGRALLPSLLKYQLPIWPERWLTRNDAEQLENLVRSRAGAKWLASEDFSETIGHMRRAIQIPSAAHCALEYQRWAVRSQLRGEGGRFMGSMNRELAVPLLHLRGEADPYVLSDPVRRTLRYAPHGRYVSVGGAGHFSHEESPEVVNEQLTRFLGQVYSPSVS